MIEGTYTVLEMSRHLLCFSFIIFLFIYEVSATENGSRQKRCIVIQKQSGGRADSGEGSDDEDYDFKRPQPKDPRPDRLQAPRINGLNAGDVETLTPEFLKYKAPSKMPVFRKLVKKRLKNLF